MQGSLKSLWGAPDDKNRLACSCHQVLSIGPDARIGAPRFAGLPKRSLHYAYASCRIFQISDYLCVAEGDQCPNIFISVISVSPW
jgi:hypothetical protein